MMTEVYKSREEPKGIDVVTKLRHFAIVTYYVDLEKVRSMIHPRFVPIELEDSSGDRKALLSVVPFFDLDFHFVSFPYFYWKFPQTNYRIYVKDQTTGENVVWFLGTTLGSWTVNIPKYLWKLPWYPGNFSFDAHYNENSRKYSKFSMSTKSKWADARLDIADSGNSANELSGFSSFEEGFFILTHPMKGFYYRTDGRLGSYSIWHKKLEVTHGSVVEARFDLLDRLGLVESTNLNNIHSVLIQNLTEFTIYLPPFVVKGS